MKKCKACQSEIDEKATICPHCRTKQPKKVGKVTAIVATIISAAIVLSIFGAIIGGSGNSMNSNNNSTSTATQTPALPTGTPEPTKDPARVKADYKANAQSVTVADIAKDPNYYKGLPVTFTGTILNFVQDSSGNTSGANVSDSNNYSSIIQVIFSPFVEIQSMNKGDSIIVWGKGKGSFTGKNAFGGTVQEGAVQEIYLNDRTSGYIDELDSNPNSR